MTKWFLQLSRSDDRASWRFWYEVYYKDKPVAEILRDEGNYTVFYKGEEIRHRICGCWTKETIQQLLFLIKQAYKNDYRNIEYEIDD